MSTSTPRSLATYYLSEIQGYTNQILDHSRQIEELQEKLRKVQERCEHCWRFVRQINNYSEIEWNVLYRCDECQAEKWHKGVIPVCSSCDHPLERAAPTDRQAERIRTQKKYDIRDNPPIAFRCTSCRKIHILWTIGD